MSAEEILSELLAELDGVAGPLARYAHLCTAGGVDESLCSGCVRAEVGSIAAHARTRLAKVRLGVVAA